MLQLMYNVHTCDHATCHEYQCHGVDSFECSFMYLTFSLVLVRSQLSFSSLLINFMFTLVKS